MLALSTIRHTDIDAYPGLVAGLRAEFHSDDVALVAALFLDAEADDFRWDSRVAERGLAPCAEAPEDADTALDRVAIFGQLAGNWYAAIAWVDGDGRLWAMQSCSEFKHRLEAERAFLASE